MEDIPIEIRQGETFVKTVSYFSGVDVVKAISAIARGYPTVLTSAGHGLPTSAIPASFTGTPDWLDTESLLPADRIYATKIDANSFSVDIDSTGLAAYAGGGHAIYTPAKDFTGYTARMQIRKSVASAAVLLELTTENGGIVLGPAGAVTLTIEAEDTADFVAPAAVYDVELEHTSSGVVKTLFGGAVSLSKEVTRPVL